MGEFVKVYSVKGDTYATIKLIEPASVRNDFLHSIYHYKAEKYKKSFQLITRNLFNDEKPI